MALTFGELSPVSVDCIRHLLAHDAEIRDKQLSSDR